MLKRATIGDFEAIEKFCDRDICGIKSLCQIKAYGFERDFLEIWCMRNEEEVCTIVTRFYDDITISSSEEADFEQLKVFLDMFYWKTVMCPKWLCEKLDLKNATVKNGYKYSAKLISDCSAERLLEDDFRSAYSLISREIPGSFKESRDAFLSFLSDYTFRERRGFARGFCTHSDGKLSSVAITSAETDKNAIISGVACDSSLRKKGLGKNTVHAIAESLVKSGKKPFVIALNESAEGFYEHIGFNFVEKIAFVERKNDV